MKNCYYADGVEDVALAGGMVRMRLFCYASRPEEMPGEVPLREDAGQLVLPPAGFLKAFEAMEQLVCRLEAAGMVARRTSSVASSNVAEEVIRKTEVPGEHGSPNFHHEDYGYTGV